MSEAKATGSCLCGAVHYTLEAAPVGTFACHCKDCQRQSGTAFSVIMGVPESGVKVEGEPATYLGRGDSGNAVQRKFCGKCGSPLFSIVEATPGVLWIKTGTIDDTHSLNPQAHIWVKSKQCWVDTGELPTFDTDPVL
ncbi:MAG: GFA family protein [Novosphingobium sp.]|nr:GFA family protein [Novosphingobium sp.]